MNTTLGRWLLPLLLLALVLLAAGGWFAFSRLQRQLTGGGSPAAARSEAMAKEAAALSEWMSYSASELAAQQRDFQERMEKQRRESGATGPLPAEQRDQFAAERLELLRQLEEAGSRGDRERMVELLRQFQEKSGIQPPAANRPGQPPAGDPALPKGG